jgi:gluconokinase
MVKTFVIMGVSGCGKSFIGKKLSQSLGAIFEDADDFHPLTNKQKMTDKIPLTDADRWPWLAVLRNQIVWHRGNNLSYVLACSALKQSYRDLLRGDDSQATLTFVYLKGTKELIRQRMEQRQHFMPIGLLESQFAILEAPQEQAAIIVEIELTPDEIVNAILTKSAAYFSQ